MRFLTPSLPARCSYAALCVLMACFLALPGCLAGAFKPDTAFAEETRLEKRDDKPRGKKGKPGAQKDAGGFKPKAKRANAKNRQY